MELRPEWQLQPRKEHQFATLLSTWIRPCFEISADGKKSLTHLAEAIDVSKSYHCTVLMGIQETRKGSYPTRLLEAGDTPYLICEDFNIVPQDSPSIAGLIAKGQLVDVPDALGQGGQHTFSSEGTPQEGHEVPGRTRIDSILANNVAPPLIGACRLRCDLDLSDHVPIEVEMDMERYAAEGKVPNIQAPLTEVQWPKNKDEKKGRRASDTKSGVKHGPQTLEDSSRRRQCKTLRSCTDSGAQRQPKRPKHSQAP